MINFVVKNEPAPGWERGRWWRVVGPDGSLWCETSDLDYALKVMRPGDSLLKEFFRVERVFIPWETDAL